MKAQEHIFKAIDIRGIYGEDLDEDIMEKIGLSFGKLVEMGKVAVSSDVRKSSPALRSAIIKGITEAGLDCIDLEELPIGMATFYGWKNKTPTAYVTASHLPKEWNGVKFFHTNGTIFHEEENKKIREIFFEEGKKQAKAGIVSKENRENVMNDYEKFLKEKISFKRSIKVAFDFGNGATALFKDTLKKIGIEPVLIFDNPDGDFPNRDSDPTTSDLEELKKTVLSCDIGFAFDGDGDRVVVSDEKGRILSIEQFTLIMLEGLFRKENGGVVANIECSSVIEEYAKKFSRDVHRVKVGHTFMAKEVEEKKACFGIEKSGHCSAPSISEFHDVMPVALYMASILSGKREKLSELVDKIPTTNFTRKAYDCDYKKTKNVMEHIENKIRNKYTKVMTIDGIRVDFEDGWALIRASNTEPILRLSVEAKTEKRMNEILKEFAEITEKSISHFS